MKCIIKYILIISVVFNHSISIEFTSWPGVRRTTGEIAEHVTLEWTTDLDFAQSGDVFELHNPNGTTILSHFFGTSYYEGHNNSSLDIRFDSRTVTFELKYPRADRHSTGNYTCTIITTVSNPSGPAITNSWAVLYQYAAPDTPTLPRPSDTSLGSTVTLTCSSSSNSVPKEYREPLVYTWMRNSTTLGPDLPPRHTLSTDGRRMSIANVQKSDRYQGYSCLAQDGGLASGYSNTVNIPVIYAPGPATLSGAPSSPLIDGENTRVVLSCTTTDQGYPEAEFYWSKDGQNKTGGQTGTFVIPQDGATVSGHDGVWRCTPYNVVGSGTPGSATVTVNDRASVSTSLPGSHTAVADIVPSLDVTCGIRSKPGATLTWTRDNTNLPSGVTKTTLTSDTNNKMITVTQSLVWDSQSDVSERRQAGGMYRCTAEVDLGTGQTDTEQTQMQLNVQYHPYGITFSGAPDHETVVAGEGSVTRTCAANCKPTCSFEWRDQHGNKTSGPTLDFTPPQREDHGIYTCQASNVHNFKTKTFNLTVNYATIIDRFDLSSPSITHNDTLTLTCDVSSRPESTITITNNDNGTVLTTVQGQQASYSFSVVQCLDTGWYSCGAHNQIGPSSVDEKVFMNVTCPVSPSRVDKKHGVMLEQNVTLSQMMTGNPLPDISLSSWTFIARNDTRSISLPDNVHFMYTDRGYVQKELFFFIDSVTTDNFGVYTQRATNNFGVESVISITIDPEGQPQMPSSTYTSRVTAVSVTVEWITGFDGGPDQTFTISHKNLETGEVLEQTGIEDNGPTSGHLISEKITEGIEPNTEYEIVVIAVNKLGETPGDKVRFTTPELASFSDTSGPSITLYENKTDAEIHFVISGQLSHVGVTNCEDGTSNCRSDNVTVPNEAQGRRRRELTNMGGQTFDGDWNKISFWNSPLHRHKRTTSTIHDFMTTVKLVSDGADKYSFTFQMFDGDDLLNEPLQVTVSGGKGKGNLLLIIGVVVGVVAALLVIVIIIILWRKGILPSGKQRKNSNDQNRVHGEFREEPNPVFSATDDQNGNGIDINPYDVTNTATGPPVRSTNVQTRQNGNNGVVTDEYAVVQKPKKSTNVMAPTVDLYSEVQTNTPKPDQASHSRPVSVYPPSATNGTHKTEDVYAVVNKPSKKPQTGAQTNVNREGEKKGAHGFGFPKGKQRAHGQQGEQYENVALGTPNGKPQSANADQPYCNVANSSGPEGAYSEVQIPGTKSPIVNEEPYQNFGEENPNLPSDVKNGWYIDEDGLQYALLDQVALNTEAEEAAARGEEPKIHGLENRTDYALIDYNKLAAKGKKKK